MFAVDASATVCRLTRQKARGVGLSVSVLHADMRSFRLPEKVDLVTCEFDAFNHVPRKADLDRVARAVARALRPGGHFFFDVNNRPSFEKLWPLAWWQELPDAVMVLHGRYDRRRDKAWTVGECFIRKGKYWQRFRERFEEVAWTEAEIRQSLRRAGFDAIQALDDTPFATPESKISPGFRTI